MDNGVGTQSAGIIYTISCIAGLFAIIGGLYALYRRFIFPRLNSTKLRHLYVLIQDWFDAIDRSDITNLNLAELGVLEKRIDACLRDNNFGSHRMCFSPRFRRRFLKYCGFGKDVWNDPVLFEKYSRVPAEGISLQSFWWATMGAFYEFKKHFDAKDGQSRFEEIEMRITLLRLRAKDSSLKASHSITQP